MAGTGHGSGPSSFRKYELEDADLVLVSQRLTGDNYSSWSREMHIALLTRNKFCMVDGSTPIPDAMEPEPGRYRMWLDENNIVISWLLNSISEDITPTVAHYNSAAAIWKDLKDRFDRPNGLGLFQLKKELMSLAQGELTVGQYYTKLKALWDEMNGRRHLKECTCGALNPLLDHLDKDLVAQFLIGLNDEFADVRDRILLMEPLPPIHEVYSLVVQEENQNPSLLLGSFSHQSKNAYYTNDAKNQNKNCSFCFLCGIRGHTVSKCFKLNGDRRICTNCGIRGHTVHKCFQLLGDPIPRCTHCGIRGHTVSKCFKLNSHRLCTNCGIRGHTVDRCFELDGYPPGYKAKSRKY